MDGPATLAPLMERTYPDLRVRALRDAGPPVELVGTDE